MISKDTTAELFQIRVRGAIARMLDARRREPTEKEWKMLRGQQAISMRDLGEIAYELDFDVALASWERKNDEHPEES